MEVAESLLMFYVQHHQLVGRAVIQKTNTYTIQDSPSSELTVPQNGSLYRWSQMSPHLSFPGADRMGFREVREWFWR